jgi:quercetin dioxygenase-like cupin family protein
MSVPATEEFATAAIEAEPLIEVASARDPQVRAKFALLVASPQTASSQVVYLEFDPGVNAPRHAHSAEEVLLILEGTAELEAGGLRRVLQEGELGVIPAMVPHSPANAGVGTLRAIAFFPSAVVTNIFEDALEPFGTKTVVTPPPEEVA